MVMLEVFCSDFMPEADDKGQRTFRFAIDCQETVGNRWAEQRGFLPFVGGLNAGLPLLR